MFRVKNTWHAFRKNLKQGGVRGLWRGCVPNVQRAALVNLGGMFISNYYKKMRELHGYKLIMCSMCKSNYRLRNRFITDLTTYDTAKHLILKHTSLHDDYKTHALSRYVSIAHRTCVYCMWFLCNVYRFRYYDEFIVTFFVQCDLEQ